jgi:hypothetical protein
MDLSSIFNKKCEFLLRDGFLRQNFFASGGQGDSFEQLQPRA